MAVRTHPRPTLDDIPLKAATVLTSSPAVERRNMGARAALLGRIQNEFHEMPGLSLTLIQASRLFGLPKDACQRVLCGLADCGVLRLAKDGQFRLHSNAA